MMERKPNFKYKDPAVLGKARRTALGSSVLPTVDRAARHPDASRRALLSPYDLFALAQKKKYLEFL